MLNRRMSQLLCREGYAAGYNYDTKVSDWVSYWMTAARLCS